MAHLVPLCKLSLYRPNSNECYGSVHIVLNENLTLIEIESISENIRLELKEKGINHFIIQPESIKYHHDNIDCLIHL